MTTSTKPRRNILIVEDEADLASLVSYNLGREGYHCRVASTGDEALGAAEKQPPDLILLDRMLPGLSGDEVAARLRREPRLRHIPIIMLTAKGEESDELVGFAVGADDYITKPFSHKLLAARVAAMLRRNEPDEAETDTLTVGPISADRGRHELAIEGRPVTVTATEFRLLVALMQARGRVLDRSQLIARALGADVVVSDRTIDVHVTGLRKKIGTEAAAWIHTVRGVGYALRSPAEAENPADA